MILCSIWKCELLPLIVIYFAAFINNNARSFTKLRESFWYLLTKNLSYDIILIRLSQCKKHAGGMAFCVGIFCFQGKVNMIGERSDSIE